MCYLGETTITEERTVYYSGEDSVLLMRVQCVSEEKPVYY